MSCEECSIVTCHMAVVTVRCYTELRYCHGKSSVRPSICNVGGL